MMDDLTIHGLPRVYSQKRPIAKLFWALFFSAGCGVLMLVIWLSLVKFWNYPFTTTIEYKRKASLPYPAITICDTDRRSYEPFKEEKFTRSCFANDTRNKSELFTHGCRLFLAGFHEGCVYDSGKPCSFPTHFDPTAHWNFCYTFNKNGSLLQAMEEDQYGFEVMMLKNETRLTMEEAEEVPPLRSTHLRRGLVLQVHSPRYTIGFNSKQIISLLPGYYTEVALTKVEKTRLKAPYSSGCATGNIAPTIFSGEYTEYGCTASCFLLKMYEKCGDVLPEGRVFMPHDKYPKRPIPGNLNQCFFGVYAASGKLNCNCPPSCFEEQFQFEVRRTPLRVTSMTPKMNKNLAKVLNVSEEEISLDFYREYIVRLNVYYGSFLMESSEEHALYDIESLLGDVGGLMGLLIGASVISLVELLWLAVATILKKRLRKTVVTDDSKV